MRSGQKNETVDKVIPDLAPRSPPPAAAVGQRNGVPLLPVRNPRPRVTAETVNELRDELL